VKRTVRPSAAAKTVKPAPAARPAPAAKAAPAAKPTPAAKRGPAAKVAKATKPAKAAKPAKAPKAPKAAKPAKPAPAAPTPPAVAAKPERVKEKLVRDSFTMPRSDFLLVQQLKERALGFRHAAKKSELLRAGLHALARLGAAELESLLKSLPALKSGRPRKAG